MCLCDPLFLQLSSDDSTLTIPVSAEIQGSMEFANSVARYTKPGSDGVAIDPAFKDYIVPMGKTNAYCVPILPRVAPASPSSPIALSPL